MLNHRDARCKLHVCLVCLVCLTLLTCFYVPSKLPVCQLGREGRCIMCVEQVGSTLCVLIVLYCATIATKQYAPGNLPFC